MIMGKSLYEVQSEISSRELNIWSLYRNKYGPLNPVRMYDQGSALVSSQINNSHGGKAKPNDFIFYGKEPEPEMDTATMIDVLINSGKARMGR